MAGIQLEIDLVDIVALAPSVIQGFVPGVGHNDSPLEMGFDLR